MSVSGNIARMRREALGMSLEEVAEKSHIPADKLRQFEGGAIKRLEQNEMVRLARALDLSLGELLGIYDIADDDYERDERERPKRAARGRSKRS